MKLLTKDLMKGKTVLVGEVIGDTLFKDVEQARHFMRVTNGYGIQDEAFNEIKKRDLKTIVIRETDTGCQWEATVSDWEKFGKSANYGHGKQRFLSLRYYRLHKKPLPMSQVLENREIRSEVYKPNLF